MLQKHQSPSASSHLLEGLFFRCTSLDRTSLSEFCNPRKHLISEKVNDRTRAEGLLEMCELLIIRNDLGSDIYLL